jgi:hypothetical protein
VATVLPFGRAKIFVPSIVMQQEISQHRRVIEDKKGGGKFSRRPSVNQG